MQYDCKLYAVVPKRIIDIVFDYIKKTTKYTQKYNSMAFAYTLSLYNFMDKENTFI